MRRSRPRHLCPQDYLLLGIAALGGALEFYDFIIFVFFAVVIGKLFFPPGVPEWLLTIQVFGVFGTGYLVRPLGGIILAHFGDLFGRKRIFAFSILLMALSTFGMASLPVYASIGVAAPVLLVITRILQGAAIGGEIPGAWTFVAEHVPSRQVGFGCGVLCAGLTLGILLGVFVAALINELFTSIDVAAFAWRIPFFIGAVFGLIAVYLRRWLRETPVFSEMAKSHRLVPELPLKVVLRDYPRSIAVSLLLTWFLSAGVVVTTLMTATFLQQLYGYTAQQSLLATGFGTLFLIFGSAAAGAIVDRVGLRGFFVAGSIFFGAATFTFYSFAAVSLPIALALYALMGLSVGMVSAVPYAMVRAFPACVRFTGVSFSYNLSYAVFGGLTPAAVGLLLPLNPMAPAYYLLFIAALALGIGLYLCKNGDGLEFPAGIEERAALACQQ